LTASTTQHSCEPSPSAAPRSSHSRPNGPSRHPRRQAAALATRKPKPDPEPEETFYQWAARSLAKHGIGPAELAATMRGGRAQARARADDDPTALLDWLAGPDGLTAQASTFARRDVLDALAKRLPLVGTAAKTLQRLERLANDYLASERAVPVTIDQGLDEQRWSTPELPAAMPRSAKRVYMPMRKVS